MNEMFTPDPEGDPEEEAELTYRLQMAMHDYNPGPNGKCIEEVQKFCYEHKRVDFHNPCNSPSYSVLHYEAHEGHDQYDY